MEGTPIEESIKNVEEGIEFNDIMGNNTSLPLVASSGGSFISSKNITVTIIIGLAALLLQYTDSILESTIGGIVTPEGKNTFKGSVVKALIIALIAFTALFLV